MSTRQASTAVVTPITVRSLTAKVKALRTLEGKTDGVKVKVDEVLSLAEVARFAEIDASRDLSAALIEAIDSKIIDNAGVSKIYYGADAINRKGVALDDRAHGKQGSRLVTSAKMVMASPERDTDKRAALTLRQAMAVKGTKGNVATGKSVGKGTPTTPKTADDKVMIHVRNLDQAMSDGFGALNADTLAALSTLASKIGKVVDGTFTVEAPAPVLEAVTA